MTFEEVKKFKVTPIIQMGQLAPQIANYAAIVAGHYSGCIGELTVVPVLTGAMTFASDFTRNFRLPIKVEPVTVKTYNGEMPGRKPLCTDDLSFAQGRHILIVEDILDTGATLAHLMARFRAEQAMSVEVLTLIRKNGTQTAFLEEPKWVLFNVPPVFVVGYGMDYHGYHRNLPFVAAMDVPKKPVIEIAK